MTNTRKPMPHQGGSFIRNPDGSLKMAAKAVVDEVTAPEQPVETTIEPSSTKSTKKTVKEG